MRKLCPRCNRKRDQKQFSTRDGTRLNSYCAECQDQYSKEHYQKNKELHNRRRLLNQRKYRATARKILDDLKSVPCADCGEQHPPWAMDFHHRDRSKKLFSIGDTMSKLRSMGAMKPIMEELKKCDLLCSLCHRYRTHNQRRVGQSGSPLGLGPRSRQFESGHAD